MSALYVTLVGVVGTQPQAKEFNGTPLLNFRMVVAERRFDNVSQTWLDAHASWVTVSCFRKLARNAAQSLQKGDRVIVHGKMKVRDYRTETGQDRTTVDVEAQSVGHDLLFGTTRFSPALASESTDDRLRRQAEALAREQAELPRESVRELVAQRAAANTTGTTGTTGSAGRSDDRPPYHDPDDEPGMLDEDELADDEFEADVDGDRRTPASPMAAVG